MCREQVLGAGVVGEWAGDRAGLSSEALTYVIVIALIGLALSMPIAGELGKHAEKASTATS
jgi:hypothetical protein